MKKINKNSSLLLATAFVVVLSLISCQTSPEGGSDPDSASDRSAILVDAKYSLTKDRTELDTLRESIPVDVKKKNDEAALMAEWFGEFKYAPEVIREKFSNLVRKKRELFNKDMTKAREEFNKNEKKYRDTFLKNLENERKDFLRYKADREKRADFFSDQDEVRRNFFAEQREKRDEYESEVREKRKNFDDYMKEKMDDFNVELKYYSVRWKEKQDQEKLEKENSSRGSRP